MIAANPATQRLVADLFGNDLPQQSISRVPIQFERGRLQFGRTQVQLSYVAPAAFISSRTIASTLRSTRRPIGM